MNSRIQDDDYIAHVLSNLTKDYSELVTVFECDFESLSIQKLKERVRGFYRWKFDGIKGGYEMKGFITTTHCDYCKKPGHAAENCWVKYPNKRPGAYKFDKRKVNSRRNIIAANVKVKNENIIDCYSETIIDTACSYHVVNSPKLLDTGTVKNVNEILKAANGHTITLTLCGRRTINTPQGTIVLSEAYFGSEIKYNLINVPELAKKGVSASFGNGTALLKKGNNTIKLQYANGLWMLPTYDETPRIASLHMQYGSSSNPETWHKRLGHVSNYKAKKLIDKGLVPESVATFNAQNCQTCMLTNPKRRPVSSRPERSGQVTVQVDFMPIGQEVKWLKGEVGAYVYSSRHSKMIRAYPVRSVSAKEAATSLDKFCTGVLPFLGEQVNCIQTDPGMQFTSREWADTCKK